MEQFQARLLDCIDVVDIERNGDSGQICINLRSVPVNALENANVVGVAQDFSIHIAAWVIIEKPSLPFMANEEWVPATDAFTRNLYFDRSGNFLKLQMNYPNQSQSSDRGSPQFRGYNGLVIPYLLRWAGYSVSDFAIEIILAREDERWERPVKYYRFRGRLTDDYTLLSDDGVHINTSNGMDLVILKDPMPVSEG